ncbi:POU domain class 2-associating factor 2 [Zootoca vivipara]|uniref:POU domain class 2-associating factor 2 n=1 Tax=Zootoca vivipara TaxID=8524 RepID=UPI00293BBE64|nr:POU domain class 2-associating factor 2 [Zootoca vivipara]
METVPADYGKRVYQGVRVKHTVKDLLAEKRSRQTSSSRLNGSLATTQSSFVPLAGSSAMSGYYGIRRSLMADVDLQNNKQISSDIYTSSLIAKPFAYESPAVQGYPSLLDTHFIDQYADHRTASVTSGASSLFSASSPLTSVMPSFPSDSAHFLSRDSWEQAMPDSLGQSDVCPPDSLQAPSITTGCLSSHEPGVSSQYRNPTWNSPISGTQSYSFHALDDVHYAAGYSAASPYPFSSFMSTVASDLTPKMLQTSSEESSDTAPLPDNSSLWPKEDGSPLWGSYECRRTY